MDPANSVLNRLERKKTARFPFLSSENISAVRLRWELGTGAGEKKVGGAKSSVHPCRETRCLRRALCSAEGKKKKPRDSSPFSTSFASAPYKESQDSDWMELSPSPSARAAALSLSPHSLLPPLLHLLYTPSAAETAIAFPRPFSLTASTAARLVCSFPQLSATDIQHLSQHKLRFAQLIELSILLAQCFVQQQWIRYVLQSQKKKNISFSD